MMRNYVFIKSEFIQRYFSRKFRRQEFLTSIWRNTFINVRTALFFSMNKTFSDIIKKLIHRIVERQLKKTQKQKIAFKNKKK